MAREKTQESDTSRCPSEAEVLSSDAEEDRNQPPLTTVAHTVTFKVIGCTREQVYQETLRNVRDTLEQGHNVPILLTPEPTNPVDSKAIAFTCKVNGKWCRLGYVVSEILQEVHQALSALEVVKVKFAWVKYISDWSRSGPGFFAGVDVTKRGKWSYSVMRVASTR